MKQRVFRILVATTMIGLAAQTVAAQTAGPASNKPAEKKEISEEEARAIAIKQVNGKVLEVEKEKHKGQPVYSIEIRGADGVHEIVIHAVNGSILENKAKGSDTDEDDD